MCCEAGVWVGQRGPRSLLPGGRRASKPLTGHCSGLPGWPVQSACARLGRLDADLLVACQPSRFLRAMISTYALGAHRPSAACSTKCLERRLGGGLRAGRAPAPTRAWLAWVRCVHAHAPHAC